MTDQAETQGGVARDSEVAALTLTVISQVARIDALESRLESLTTRVEDLEVRQESVNSRAGSSH